MRSSTTSSGYYKLCGKFNILCSGYTNSMHDYFHMTKNNHKIRVCALLEVNKFNCEFKWHVCICMYVDVYV